MPKGHAQACPVPRASVASVIDLAAARAPAPDTPYALIELRQPALISDERSHLERVTATGIGEPGRGHAATGHECASKPAHRLVHPIRAVRVDGCKPCLNKLHAPSVDGGHRPLL